MKKGLSFLLILLLVGTPLSLIRAADDWPKSGFDNCNTAYSPSQIEGFKPWNRTLGDTVATPVIAGNMLYVATHNSSIGGKDFLYSLNAGTGDEKWNFTTHLGIYTDPIVAAGVVYIGLNSGDIQALNASTGQALWISMASSSIGGPLNCVNGVLYYGSVDGNVYAVNASTGQKIWSYTTGNYVWNVCPVVVDDRLFIASCDKNIYALHASNGSKIWSYTTGDQITSVSPAFANGIVYIGSEDQNFYAVNSSTGSLVWSAIIMGPPLTSSVKNGVVYVGVRASWSSIYAFSALTGQMIWLQMIEGSFVQSLAVDEVTIYLVLKNSGVSYEVLALDPSTGQRLRSYPFSDWPSPPVISGNALFIGDQNGELHAFDVLEVTPPPTQTASPTPAATPTPKSSATPLPPTPSPTLTPNVSVSNVSATIDSGSIVNLQISGNITNTQISNVTIMTNQTTSKTTVEFTITGQTGTTGFANITIPKSAVPQGSNPIVLIDSQPCTNQGYTQDSTNYYIWYYAHFSLHKVLIAFEDTRPATATPTAGEVSVLTIIFASVIGIAVTISIVAVLGLLLRNKKRKKDD